jgi:hypothetical protein
MSTSLSTKMNYRNANQFVDTVVNGDANLYVYIGRPQPWDNESVPDVPDDSLSTEYDVWHDMTAMKRVTAQDIRLGFRRIDWTINTAYDQYDDTANLNVLDFYVYTDEGKVYKCISNNAAAESTIKPTQTTGTQVTSDGYKWKYMFTISDSLYRKFAVGDYLPIELDSTVITNAVVGSIDQLVLESAGTGYTPSALASSNTALPIYIYGDGNENATATCTITVNSGIIQGVVVTNGGVNYSNPLESNVPVMIRQIGSTGAIETAFGTATTNADNEIINVDIVLGGSGYASGTAIIVQSSCQGYAETNSIGVVTNVEISNGYAGTNFRVARATVVDASITPAVVRPIISPFRGHGASPERELLANYALVNLTFAYNEGANDFTVQNEFRRIGLIENPYTYGTTTIASAQTLNAKNTLIISNVSGAFSADDAIYGLTTGAKGIYVDTVDSTKLRFIKDDNTLSNNLDFTTEDIRSQSGATATITEVINPEVEPYSGDILFINNTVAINRASDQLETVTLVLEY